ncbi:Arginine ABC transporter, periplasmic arginine-binding protein ArtI [Enterobacter sp. FY-07]|nr:Arginine ABC transporter, periplasmic arginine-binding protein ArtI [Enterobacter sp. FY-07]
MKSKWRAKQPAAWCIWKTVTLLSKGMRAALPRRRPTRLNTTYLTEDSGIMTMKKVLIAALLASVSLSATAAQTIRFATEASYPPFESTDANNKIVGFDVDLANALCKEIDATCTFTNQAFDSLIPSLKFRRFDAVMAGMDITPEREKQVLFTTPYYDNSALFVGQQGKFTSIDQLKGKRVGVQNGTTHQKFINDKHPEITTVPYDSYQNARLDLQNGRIDAVFGDTAVVTEWLKADTKLAAVGDKVTDKEYFGTGLGIAVRQGNTELQQKFNTALEKVKKDGTYQTIYNKWFQK